MEHLLRHMNFSSLGILLKPMSIQHRNFPVLTKLSHLRAFSVGKQRLANYEGDGRTTVSILNKENKHILMINGYSTFGFRLNNGIFAAGPIAIFPKSVLHWNVNTASDISPESLSLFSVLEPKLDILVLGTGDNRVSLGSEVEHFLRSKRLSAEILPTDQACNVFNFLNVEGRCVAGAFIPPLVVTHYTDELTLIGNKPELDVFK